MASTTILEKVDNTQQTTATKEGTAHPTQAVIITDRPNTKHVSTDAPQSTHTTWKSTGTDQKQYLAQSTTITEKANKIQASVIVPHTTNIIQRSPDKIRHSTQTTLVTKQRNTIPISTDGPQRSHTQPTSSAGGEVIRTAEKTTITDSRANNGQTSRERQLTTRKSLGKADKPTPRAGKAGTKNNRRAFIIGGSDHRHMIYVVSTGLNYLF